MYIIGTVGPTVKDRTALKGIVDNGVNALRFNFAHGSDNEFFGFLQMAREIKDDVNIILDISGTKIRISNKFQYIYKVYNNEEVIFCGEDQYEKIRADLKDIRIKIFPLNIKSNILCRNDFDKISIKDNTMIFQITSKEKNLIRARAVKGGIIRKGKGCNIKDFDRSMLSISKKDRKAIIWGIKNNVDIICQSFVESREDVMAIKQFISAHKNENTHIKIWAKIETLKGVDNVDEIIDEADGVVIGRGDLIPETSIEDTPVYEERIIEKVSKIENKDIIIATHLFNSMKLGKMPYLSEVESVYNFIRKGVTGFLLAGETSVGKAPIKTVQFLRKLVSKYEMNIE
ncbi:pyruvate kinase [uncultured Clostridium sp.]|uniref:pyruvate kinase n=1 Tax=uncultured Clostridium sp. TaxID=59620 RepID=UPI0025F12202|nr:pyruvate kinase [uncultured Clostridium sp.]